jgi:arylsulfatase A-like enzyme
LIGGRPRRQRQNGSDLVDAAIRWLARVPPRGFYLWVHLLEPHLPYRNAPAPRSPVVGRKTLRNSLPLDADERAAVHAGYAAEVAYVDRHLGRLLDALEAKGVLDSGIVVFTSDHGEEFWEHGGLEHGHSHHAEVLDVPLVLIAPGLAPGSRGGVASLVDVVPTIRAALGDDPGGIDLRDGVPADRIATAWGGLLVRSDCSARDRRQRAIVRDCADTEDAVQVFDLQADPAERWPLRWAPTDTVVSAARNVSPPVQGDVAPVDRERLRALGYLQ